MKQGGDEGLVETGGLGAPRGVLYFDERDRRRLALELRDEILQSLSAIQLLLASSRQSRSSEDLRATIDAGAAQLGEQIVALRSLSTELRPAVLDHLGLTAALRSLAEHHASVEDLDVTVRVELAEGDGPARLGPEVESVVYRVAQEALANVARHARASHVELSLAEADGTVELAIRDDGVGFDPGESARGWGLAAIRRRIELIGGRVEISSNPGGGTGLLARAPSGGTLLPAA